MQKHDCDPDGDEEAFRALGLRPATSDDEPFLLKLFASTRSDELALMNWDEDQKEAFIAMQFNAQRRCYPEADDRIILLNDLPVGRLTVARTEATILLVDIALLPEYRNAGIGTTLIRGLLKEAVTAGKPVRLHALTSSAAVRLYERLGFSRIGVDAAYLEMMWFPPVSRAC